MNDPYDTRGGANGTTWVYTYDLGGNIQSFRRYAYTETDLGTKQAQTNYTYGDSGWKDLLTAYGGGAIQNDAIGNILSSGAWTYEWRHGRELYHMHRTSTSPHAIDVRFEYNEDGLRTKKTVLDEVTHVETVTEYTLHGKNIVHLKQGSNSLHFYYDAQNKPAIVEWNNGTTTASYAYVYNLQGDVIALTDSIGVKVVGYTYDAWGKPLSTTGSLRTTLGKLNPFLYRGYVYDDEIDFYYLKSRYYNANRGRFINADNKFSGNLYTYCNNRPIMEIDDSGRNGREIMEACNGILSGTHSLDSEKLPAATFIEMLEYMVDEQWMYPDINENGDRYPTSWGIADCYGIYVACMKAYYTPEDFEKLSTGTTCYWAEKNATYKRCIRKNRKLIRSEVKNLQIGMGVLITHMSEGTRYYDHIAYVAGFNDDGSVDLIESNVDEHNNVLPVKHTTLNDKYVWAVKLAGVLY